MPRHDDFSMLDFYATLLAAGGWLVLVVGFVVMLFTFSAGTFLAGLALLPTLVGGIALLAAAKLLRCVLLIHRDTRALLDRAAAPAAE